MCVFRVLCVRCCEQSGLPIVSPQAVYVFRKYLDLCLSHLRGRDSAKKKKASVWRASGSGAPAARLSLLGAGDPYAPAAAAAAAAAAASAAAAAAASVAVAADKGGVTDAAAASIAPLLFDEPPQPAAAAASTRPAGWAAKAGGTPASGKQALEDLQSYPALSSFIPGA
jgi:hypothetical protein